MFPNHPIGSPLDPIGCTPYTPTIPQFYWDMESSEQRIKYLCVLYDRLMKYVNGVKDRVNLNSDAIKELQDAFQKFMDSGFDDYYAEQVEKWIAENMQAIVDAMAMKTVYFGLTLDGYFVAYIPDSWSDVVFDTGAVYGTEEYGRLLLRYNVDAPANEVDNYYDPSALDKAVRHVLEGMGLSSLTDLAGEGLTVDEGKLIVNVGNGVSINPNTGMLEIPIGEHLRYTSDGIDVPEGDSVTPGVVKLVHEVSNSTDPLDAVSPQAVYAWAYSKAESDELFEPKA